MEASIFILTGVNGKKEVSLKEGRYTLGRGENANIQIISEQISRIHAEIIVDAEESRIVDKGSANGTAVNGRFISTSSLKHGDKILIGDITLEFSCPEQKNVAPVRHLEDDGKSKLFVAATKVISDKLRPRSLWPLFMILFSVGFIPLVLIVTSIYTSFSKSKLQEIIVDKGFNLVQLLAEKNKDDLGKNNELLLDVDTVLTERGVKSATIIDQNSRIIAPTSKKNQLDRDPRVLELINSQSAKGPLPYQNKSGFTVFIYPIRNYDQQVGMYKTIGVAKIIFSQSDAIGNLSEFQRLFLVSILFAFLLAALISFLAARILSKPIESLADTINRWRRGDKENLDQNRVPYKEWTVLYEAVDLAMEKKNE